MLVTARAEQSNRATTALSPLLPKFISASTEVVSTLLERTAYKRREVTFRLVGRALPLHCQNVTRLSDPG
jgi:hypothetical protein